MSPSYNELVKASRPTLFSVTGHPQLAISLILANLMSPKLHELASNIKISAEKKSAPSTISPSDIFSEIQQYLNKHFYHATQKEFAGIWGLHEKEYITDPDEIETTDYTIAAIKKSLDKIGDHPFKDLLINLSNSGFFPQYVYPTIDGIAALSKLLKGRHARSSGITSCLDECILIASLSIACGACRLEDIVLLGSPFHFTLFIFSGNDAFWFNAKREMFDSQAWASFCEQECGTEKQELFNRKTVIFDRIITPYGHCIFPLRVSTITKHRLTMLSEKICRFIGDELSQLNDAIVFCNTSSDSVNTDLILGKLSLCKNNEEFENSAIQLAKDGLDYAESALYTFRHPKVEHPAVYVSAALKGYKVFLKSGEVLTIEDGVDIANSIAGNTSIFGESWRIALPDEVLITDTANHNERALLLYSLLQLSDRISDEQKERISFSMKPDRCDIFYCNKELI